MEVGVQICIQYTRRGIGQTRIGSNIPPGQYLRDGQSTHPRLLVQRWKLGPAAFLAHFTLSLSLYHIGDDEGKRERKRKVNATVSTKFTSTCLPSNSNISCLPRGLAAASLARSLPGPLVSLRGFRRCSLTQCLTRPAPLWSRRARFPSFLFSHPLPCSFYYKRLKLCWSSCLLYIYICSRCTNLRSPEGIDMGKKDKNRISSRKDGSENKKQKEIL